MTASAAPDHAVERVLWVEAGINVCAIAGKLAVGFQTGSAVVIADAIHSATDVANNALALIAARIASAPPDHEHPYGHRKFETLAVFTLAVLLSVLAVEIAIRALSAGEREVSPSTWGLFVMLSVLVLQVSTSLWESGRARALDSELLQADARHTAGDALTTVAVIVGWQLAAAGYPKLDALFTLGVSALILWLAFGLFRRAIPILVDRAAEPPEDLGEQIALVPGVRSVGRLRSLRSGEGLRVDVVIRVDADLSTRESHAIADRVEAALAQRLGKVDVSVHVEPAE